MKYMHKLMMVMMMAAMTSAGAMAKEGRGKNGNNAPGVDKRIERQKKRISHKLEKGKITQDQANTLNQKVDAVQAKEEELKKDGKLTKEERKELHQDLNKNNQEIKNSVPQSNSGH